MAGTLVNAVLCLSATDRIGACNVHDVQVSCGLQDSTSKAHAFGVCGSDGCARMAGLAV